MLPNINFRNGSKGTLFSNDPPLTDTTWNINSMGSTLYESKHKDISYNELNTNHTQISLQQEERINIADVLLGQADNGSQNRNPRHGGANLDQIRQVSLASVLQRGETRTIEDNIPGDLAAVNRILGNYISSSENHISGNNFIIKNNIQEKEAMRLNSLPPYNETPRNSLQPPSSLSLSRSPKDSVCPTPSCSNCPTPGIQTPTLNPYQSLPRTQQDDEEEESEKSEPLHKPNNGLAPGAKAIVFFIIIVCTSNFELGMCIFNGSCTFIFWAWIQYVTSDSKGEMSGCGRRKQRLQENGDGDVERLLGRQISARTSGVWGDMGDNDALASLGRTSTCETFSYNTIYGHTCLIYFDPPQQSVRGLVIDARRNLAI